jgi:hypothetical protein
MLEQIAVIAGEFDHRALRVQAQPSDHHVRMGSGMLHPTIRVGGKIRVLGEKLGRGEVFAQLRKHSWQTKAWSG